MEREEEVGREVEKQADIYRREGEVYLRSMGD